MISYSFGKQVFYNLRVSNFWKYINYYGVEFLVYKIPCLKNDFLMISAIKEFIFKNWMWSSCRESLSRENKISFSIIILFFKLW